MLIFIGLGINDRGISLQGIEEAREADEVYAEFYTSLIPGFDIQRFEKRIGRPVKILKREDVEQRPDNMLEKAKDERVAFLVPGDPMVATTHVDLRLRAEKIGVETRVIHGASIGSAAPGLAGLQSYKFGRTATLPLSDKPSRTPYEVLKGNQELDLHTLLLLDIEAEKDRYLTADRAIEFLLDLEDELKRDVFTRETLSVVVARAGSSNPLVKAGRVKDLVDMDFGDPPHVLIVPGKLHFLEAEALKSFADVSEEALEGMEK